MSKIMSLELFVAQQNFISMNRQPAVITLSQDTSVINKGKTSDRHPTRDFDGSWMKYWMAFSGQTKDFVCSVDGMAIWIEGDKDSCDKCKEENRPFEIMYYPDTAKAEGVYNGREAHGAHVEYKGKTYIVPICASENTSLKDKEQKIILKAGTILVEEVIPIVDENG